MPRHQCITPVLSVQPWVTHQSLFGYVLLKNSVDHDWHRGVDGVVEYQECTLEQCLRAIVCVEYVQELSSEASNVFIQWELYQEWGSHIIPVAMNQERYSNFMNAKSEAWAAAVPSFPMIARPTWASWSMDTSFPPSPIAAVGIVGSAPGNIKYDNG